MRRAPEVMPEVVEELHRAAWQKLLVFVSGGVGEPGVAYRRMHSKLEAYFRWRGVEGARQLTDKTFDRIARRLASDAKIDGPASAHVLEAARSIVHELQGTEREPSRESIADAGRARTDALETCLSLLGDQDRTLFGQFHARGDQRAKLAAELGTTLPALRSKASRIRARVERCMTARLAHVEES